MVDEIITRDPTPVNTSRPKIHEGEQRRTWLPPLDSVALLSAAYGGDTYERVIPVQALRDLDKMLADRAPEAPLIVNNRGALDKRPPNVS